MPATVTNSITGLIAQLARLEGDERRVRATSTSTDPVTFECDLRRVCAQEDQVVAALHELHG